MQRMYVAGQCTSRQNGMVSKAPSRRVSGVCRLRFLRRYTRVLSVNPQGQFGGTVIPPCDFQSGFVEIPVNTGLPP